MEDQIDDNLGTLHRRRGSFGVNSEAELGHWKAHVLCNFERAVVGSYFSTHWLAVWQFECFRAQFCYLFKKCRAFRQARSKG